MADTDYLLELVAEGSIDIGHDHIVKFYAYKDVDRAGLFIVHPAAGTGQNHIPAGEPCAGSVRFDLPVNKGYGTGGAVWQVHSLEPLHVEPSVLCSCGDHGFIREGRWVPA